MMDDRTPARIITTRLGPLALGNVDVGTGASVPDAPVDCPACEALRRDQTRAALVEFRRALRMLDANAQLLIAALDLEC